VFRRKDREPSWVNIAAAIALALFAAMSLFLWTHPNYVPACAAGLAKARCVPAVPEGFAAHVFKL